MEKNVLKIMLCPNCEEEATTSETEVFLGECHACSYMFCTNCHEDYHGNVECEFNPNLLETLEEDFQFFNFVDNERTKVVCTTQFKCQICLELRSNEVAADLGCEHLNCLPCIKKYFETLINESTIYNLKCPSDCNAVITPEIVHEIVDPQIFLNYNIILLSEQLVIPKIVKCPKQNCGQQFPAEPEFGYCESCDYHFCTNCMQAYHGIIPCGDLSLFQQDICRFGSGVEDVERAKALQDIATITGCSISDLKSWIVADTLHEKQKSYVNICQYITNTNCHGFRMKVTKVFQISRLKERHISIPAKEPRLMLWHGTKKAKLSGILKNGFVRPRLAHQMFGNGIYFADRASKSLQYCDGAGVAGQKAYMLLCDVSLGRIYECGQANNKYTAAPYGFDSVKGTGKNIPDIRQNQEFNGTIYPLGKTVVNPVQNSALLYNEYIVYDVSKIRITFLIEVEFS